MLSVVQICGAAVAGFANDTILEGGASRRFWNRKTAKRIPGGDREEAGVRPFHALAGTLKLRNEFPAAAPVTRQRCGTGRLADREAVLPRGDARARAVP